MAKTKATFQTVDEYIDTFPDDVQKILKKIRQTIQKAVPGAEEVISYSIPAYKFHGWVFYFSAYTNHYTLSCPPPFTLFKAFEKELQPYGLSKSAIRFPLDKPVPVKLITAMAKFRAKENLETDKNKMKMKKK